MTKEYLIPINPKQPIENTIQFYNTNEGASVEVLRISKDGITANPNVPIDEAAEAVLRAVDGYIKQITQRTWVGLTLDERLELAQDVDWAAGAYCEYAEKVEAKLKEKNYERSTENI